MKRRVKLWQKIFLVTLSLVVAAINLTSVLLIHNSYELLVERERNNAVYEHKNLIASIKNNVAYELLKQNSSQLSKSDLLKVFEKAFGSQNNRGLSVYQNGERIDSVKPGSEQAEKEMLSKASATNNFYTNIINQNNKTWLLVASHTVIQNQSYIIISNFDVTSIDQFHQEQKNYVRWISVLCAVIIALILLIFMRMLLSPLQKVNNGMRRIAKGVYNEKVTVKGGDELAELAGNMNVMAEAIQNNITALEQVAENRKRFIDNLAHEMKTPLTSILGYADILRIKQHVSETEKQEYASVIVEEAKRLRSLSGKLMELITLGNTKMDKLERISLTDLFGQMK